MTNCKICRTTEAQGTLVTHYHDGCGVYYIDPACDTCGSLHHEPSPINDAYNHIGPRPQVYHHGQFWADDRACTARMAFHYAAQPEPETPAPQRAARPATARPAAGGSRFRHYVTCPAGSTEAEAIEAARAKYGAVENAEASVWGTRQNGAIRWEVRGSSAA